MRSVLYLRPVSYTHLDVYKRQECGLVFDGFNDVKEEDKVEAYIMVEVPRQ